MALMLALIQETQPGKPTRWWRLGAPREILAVTRLEDVPPLIERLERAAADGLYAAGFLAYEAAPAFDPALETAPPAGALPLAWWMLTDEIEEAAPPSPPGDAPRLDWRPLLDRQRYGAAIDAIHRHIERGDTYQVNYTFPLEAAYEGDCFALFAALVHAQRPRHAAYLDTGRFVVASGSPELFFSREGERLVTRPMKGTARRGRTLEEDRRQRDALRNSAKDRAENVMIVDMTRNDLGKIALPGSVRTSELFEIETYPTVHQLTSTVVARSRASLGEILRALFPSASITGAPKVRTMQLIRRLEMAPRGVYTGSVGFLAPDRAHFNVAIRTAVIDRASRRAIYGTGGGIVWDSEAESEYQECRTKAFVLSRGARPFELLETLLYKPASGIFLLRHHLERLAASAEYFGFPFREDATRGVLEEACAGLCERSRLRLLMSPDGALRVEVHAEPRGGRPSWRVGLDDRPVDSSDVFLFHKTTARKPYDDARQRHPGLDEVILWNERGELTEATRANLVLRIGGQDFTPALECGLLPGTYRAELLARGRLRERKLPKELLAQADEVFLVSSVRGWIRARTDPSDLSS